jgi:hypothetical protein
VKDVKGFEGLYCVNEKGEVFSLPKAVPVGRNGGARHQPMQKLTPQSYLPNPKYKRVYLAKNGEKYQIPVHRLIAMTFLPNPDNLPYVNHLDCNPSNNAVENLEWCTPSRNSQHAWAMGQRKMQRTLKGEDNPQSKITNEKVRFIRKEHASGRSCASIGRELGVPARLVNGVANFKSWRHVV